MALASAILIFIAAVLVAAVAGGPVVLQADATSTNKSYTTDETTTSSTSLAQHVNATESNRTLNATKRSNRTGNDTGESSASITTTVQPSTKPPVVELDGGCDFDDDFCDWVNVQKDEFDWIRNKGRTQSTSTGPEHDVSFNKSGHYAMIEASWPRRAGQVARLHSPPLTAIRCMRFFYNMYGAHMGDLRVFIIEGKKVHFVWGRYRNQDQGWKETNVTVYGDKEYVVAFFGRRGRSYASDMAIDNITFVAGTCDGKPLQDRRRSKDVEAALKVLKGEPGTCDFDTGFCEWNNVLLDDQFDWLLKGGMTGTSDTGPERDHTGQNGKYLYIESSLPQTRGHKAQILSPRLCGEICMQFYYHMYGHQVGAINIYQRIGLKTNDRIWHMGGEQGQAWHEALININGNCYQIVIEGVIGSGYLGDAAIDDVIFTKGTCCAKKWRYFDVKTAGNCSFTGGFCNWTNHERDDFDWTIHEGATDSTKTGPSKPFKGPYAYVEASEPRLPGDKAILVGPVLRGQVCMRFKYHMYGEHTGSLAVYKHGSGVPRHEVWRRSGNRGNLWRDAYVDFRCKGPLFQIEFEAVVNGWRSDIAIDEVSFEHAVCPKVKDANAPVVASTPSPPPFPISSGNCTFPGTFCDWKNDRKDDIDWELGSYTASLGTGPKRDVDGNGVYIFIEASRYRYRQQGRLTSGYLRGPKCMRFHYHMTGRSVGILKIYKVDVKRRRSRRMWYRSGRQRQGWIRAYLNFNGDGYRVAFVVVRGAKHHGDIALDDISFTPGKCKQLLETPFKYQPPKVVKRPIPLTDQTENCTFDDGNMCKWANVGGDMFDWKLWRGSTPSRHTGPTADHSGKGMYIYIEASAPRGNQDNAYLSLTTGGPARCLRFYYFMYGKHTGWLKVHQRVLAGRDRKLELLWELKGPQGKIWLQAEVDVPPAASYALIIEGVRGEDFASDTAVDDITLTDGPCSSATTTNPPQSTTQPLQSNTQPLQSNTQPPQSSAQPLQSNTQPPQSTTPLTSSNSKPGKNGGQSGTKPRDRKTLVPITPKPIPDKKQKSTESSKVKTSDGTFSGKVSTKDKMCQKSTTPRPEPTTKETPIRRPELKTDDDIQVAAALKNKRQAKLPK